MSRISELLSHSSFFSNDRGSAEVPAGCPDVSDPFWDELHGQAQGLLGSILRSKTRDGRPVRTVGLTSCYRQEGVSTIATVLARAAAAQRRTLLIDANLAHPSLAAFWNIQAEPGLVQAMSGKCQTADCIHQLPSGVSVLTAGLALGQRETFLAADRFLSLVHAISARFDLVLIDLPAVHEEPSTFELCSLLDGVALVVEAERVHWQAGQREVTRLRQSGAHLLGAVLNKRRDYIPNWLYRVL